MRRGGRWLHSAGKAMGRPERIWFTERINKD